MSLRQSLRSSDLPFFWLLLWCVVLLHVDSTLQLCSGSVPACHVQLACDQPMRRMSSIFQPKERHEMRKKCVKVKIHVNKTYRFFEVTSVHIITLIFMRYPKHLAHIIYHVSYIYITYESIAFLVHLDLMAALRATSRGHVCPVFPKRPRNICRSPWHRPGRTPRPPPNKVDETMVLNIPEKSDFTNLKHIDHHKSSTPTKRHSIPSPNITADLVRTLVSIAWLSSDLSQKILTKFGGYWFFEPNFVKSANVFETIGTFCSLCMTTGKPLHSAKRSLPSCQQNATTQKFKKDSTSSWLVLNFIGSENVHLSSWFMSCRHLPLFQTEMEPFRWSISTLMASIPCVSVGEMQITTHHISSSLQESVLWVALQVISCIH